MRVDIYFIHIIYTDSFFPIFLLFFITNAVPLDLPSQKAKISSEYSIICKFLLNGAAFPYFLYSGKNSFILIPFFKAYSLAEKSSPAAPPETISVTFFGIYLSKLKFLILRDPIIANFI